MFDLNTLFNTAGTAGMLDGMGGGSPAGVGGFAGMAEPGMMEGFGDLLGNIDPKTLAMLAGQTQGEQAPPVRGGGGLGSPLRAGQITDTTSGTIKQAQQAQTVQPRRGLGQLIYGR